MNASEVSSYADHKKLSAFVKLIIELIPALYRTACILPIELEPFMHLFLHIGFRDPAGHPQTRSVAPVLQIFRQDARRILLDQGEGAFVLCAFRAVIHTALICKGLDGLNIVEAVLQLVFLGLWGTRLVL